MALVATANGGDGGDTSANAEDAVGIGAPLSGGNVKSEIFISNDLVVPSGSPSSSYALLSYPMDLGRQSASYLSANYGKSPEFVVRLPRDLTGVLGEPAALECQIDGHPLPDIMWTKDDDDITESDDPNYSFELDAVAGLCRLTIEHCRESDQGVYRCILENCFGACSSTTSFRITDKISPTSSASAFSPSSSSSTSRYHDSEMQLAESSTTSSLSTPQSSQNTVIVRELTTISEHLSQEEGIASSFSNSIVSESPTGNIDDSIFNRVMAQVDDAIETASTSTNLSSLPMEGSVVTVTEETSESWLSDGNKPDQEEAQISPGSGTVRTVINSDPPSWRQFCITPVQSRDNSEADQEPEKLETSIHNDNTYTETVVSGGKRYIEDIAAPLPEVTIAPETTFESSALSSNFDMEANDDSVTPTYNRRQLMIRIHDQNEAESSTATTNASTDTNNPASSPMAIKDISGNSISDDHDIVSVCESSEAINETPELHIDESKLLEQTSQLSAEVVTISKDHLEIVRDPNPIEKNGIIEVNRAPNKNENSIIGALQLQPSSMASSLGPSTPIYRTLSSPSTVGSTRRGSFLDYFVDNDPKTRRRTLIIHSLIAIQITFLVVLAVTWQEHLIESGSLSANSVSVASPVVANTRASLPKTAKHSISTVAAAQIHHQAQSPSKFLGILTTPLSFVFVLIISSLFTFVFASNIQL